MKKIPFFLFILIGFIGFTVSAQNFQEIKLKTSTSNFIVKNKNSQQITLQASIAALNLTNMETKEGSFVSLSADGLIKTFNAGFPNLPVYSKLIEVPQDAKVKINIISFNEEFVDLNAYGISKKIMPSQPSISKSEDPKSAKFFYKEDVYKIDDYINKDIATYEESGILRHTRLGRIEINPIQYNPVKNILRVLNNLEIEIVFEGYNLSKTNDIKAKNASPYFNNLFGDVINYEKSKALIDDEPVTFVIVSDPMFQTQLQQFITWKRKKGFHVIEAYTNNPSVGNTTTTIKTYLQGLYNTPAPGVNPPTFVLFVGDMAQIPAYAGTAGSHVTDLYYCEYTGDKLPEVFYGRWSATTTAQLQPQIDKSLEYEQFTMPNADYLGQAVMVAGDDAANEMTYGNGQINYGTTYYFNNSNGINSHTYLQPLDNTLASTQIRQNISDGVGYANYTAHCSPDGWASPGFSVAQIDGISNAHEYGLWVGNCCLSNKFDDAVCFGEAALRAVDKGAIGYIGGTNSTYWDEDYWWGVGLTSTISANPTYAGSGLGAYDKMFHINGEATSDWFITQDQMVVGGNLANQASTSSRKTYYWEIYTLMGDPSIMPYMGIPATMAVTPSPGSLIIGMTSLTVTTEPYAYVALSYGGNLLDVALADFSGVANLTFAPLSTVGDADLVVTAQNRQPYIYTIPIVPASEPYVILNAVGVNDASGNNNGLIDFSESPLLNITLENVAALGSGYHAQNVIAKLRTASSQVTLVDTTETFGTINTGATVAVNGAFNFDVANNVPDQTTLNMLLHISGEHNSTTYYWDSPFNLIVNAPSFNIGDVTIDDATGNNDGILDAGETANIIIANTNNGHADALACVGNISCANPSLTINTSSSNIGNLSVGASGDAVFNVTAAGGIPLGTPISIGYTITSGMYTKSATKEIIVGLIPDYPIANSTVTTCVGNFYDSGGLSNEYASSESKIMTFLPNSPTSVLEFNFTSFSTEATFDFLYIYNGNSVLANQIAGSPFHGTTSPGIIRATNPDGALTFKFTSDGSVTRPGWVAEISCISLTDPPSCASGFSPADAATDVNPISSISWNAVPGATSYDVYFGTTIPSTPNANVTITTYTPTMLANTTYAYKIVPKNVVGGAIGCSTVGFTTGEMPNDFFIGNGTVEFDYPFYTYYENNKTQMLLLSSELGAEKTITNIAFDIAQVGTTVLNLKNFTIKIKPTNLSTLSNSYADMSGSDTVFSSSDFAMPTNTGWLDFDIVDYLYNGTDNLIIELNWGDNGAYSNTYYKVNATSYSSGAATLCVFGYSDSETPPSYDGNSKTRPNFKLNFLATGGSSVEASSNNNSVNIYPNPNTGVFQLDINSLNEKNASYKIFNMQNQVVSSGEIKQRFTGIDLSKRSKGVYYMQILYNNKTFIKQIIVQ